MFLCRRKRPLDRGCCSIKLLPVIPILLLKLTVLHSSLLQLVDAVVAVCGAVTLSMLNICWIVSTFIEEDINKLSLSFWAVTCN